MDETLKKLINENNDLKESLSSVKLAYNTLLTDVLSFSELISKKEDTHEILRLFLRLSRSILYFNQGVVVELSENSGKIVHSIDITPSFREKINDYIETKKYQTLSSEQRFTIIQGQDSLTRVIIPLKTRKQLIGSLDILVEEDINKSIHENLNVLWVLGSIAAIQYEVAEAKNQSSLLALILEGLEKVNSVDKLDQLLDLMMNSLRQLVPADNYNLILRDKVIEMPENINYCLLEKHLHGDICPIVADCIDQKTTILVNNVSKNLQCINCTALIENKETNAGLMLVPLYNAEKTYGVIAIYQGLNSEDVFTETNKNIIEIFAKQATIAITKAMLMDEMAEFNSILATTNDELQEKQVILLEQQEKLEKVNEELSRWNDLMQRELDTAGAVQSALLAKVDTPKFLDYELFYRPHHAIGGDYFGIQNIDETKSVIFIGDVSGKGVPAAIATGYFKNEFNYLINKGKASGVVSPAQILTDLNLSALKVFNKTEEFSSAWCGILDSASQTITFASAGHDYPILIGDTDITLLNFNNGPILGLFEEGQYEDKVIPFPKEKKLLLYTDGITDQENSFHKRLGRKWLLETVEKTTTLSPTETCQTIIEEFYLVSESTKQHDDMLLICLAFKNLAK